MFRMFSEIIVNGVRDYCGYFLMCSRVSFIRRWQFKYPHAIFFNLVILFLFLASNSNMVPVNPSVRI